MADLVYFYLLVLPATTIQTIDLKAVAVFIY